MQSMIQKNDYSFWRNCYRYLEATCSYSIIPRKDQVTLAEGDHLKIGDTNYTITKVGSFANSNLQSIAHSTLIFADAPTDEDDVIRMVFI